jgi:hypothetical protein
MGITTYDGRCALSGLPDSLLLDAAHIEQDERLGQPVVRHRVLKNPSRGVRRHLIGSNGCRSPAGP